VDSVEQVTACLDALPLVKLLIIFATLFYTLESVGQVLVPESIHYGFDSDHKQLFNPEVFLHFLPAPSAVQLLSPFLYLIMNPAKFHRLICPSLPKLNRTSHFVTSDISFHFMSLFRLDSRVEDYFAPSVENT